MTPLNEMSVDELSRLLTGSKWVLGILAVLIAVAGVFNQWVSDQITKLQAAAKVKAEKRLEQSETELQETKAKTAKLEAKLAPRALPQSEWQAISEGLVDYPGTQFQFASYQDDAEVRGLVVPMIKALRKAGWKGLPARGFLMAGLVEGVVVEYAPESADALGPAAQALAAALNAHRIAAVSAPNKELASYADRLRIKVGKKPSEPQ